MPKYVTQVNTAVEARERNLARRLKYERERRGWTVASMQGRLEAVGCPADRFIVSKIENQGRRVSAIELAAFARLYEITDLGDLFRPFPEVVSERSRELALKEIANVNAFAEAFKKYVLTRQAIEKELGLLSSDENLEFQNASGPDMWETDWDEWFTDPPHNRFSFFTGAMESAEDCASETSDGIGQQEK